MTDIIETTDTDLEDLEDAEEATKEYSGRKIMCFVSKRMIPIEDTVEVEYANGKSYRVMEQYIRYDQND